MRPFFSKKRTRNPRELISGRRRAKSRSGTIATKFKPNQEDLPKPTVLALMNAYLGGGMSGGDLWFIQVARRWTDLNLIVVTSHLGKETCIRQGLHAEFLLTTRNKPLKEKEGLLHIVFAYLIRSYRAIRLIYRLGDVDVILSTSDSGPDVLPAFLFSGRRKHTSWVQCTYHIVKHSPKRLLMSSAQTLMHRLIRQRAHVVLAGSHLLKAELTNRGILPEKIEITSYGVGIGNRSNGSRPFRSGSGQAHYDALFVGRLHESKGIFDLPEIWAIVNKKLPMAKLGIVGHGTSSVQNELRSKLRNCGVENNVEILGYLTDQELDDLYLSSRVFAFPSHEEGFGLVILEALASGLPAVTWSLPIFQEHFGSITFTVPEGDLNAFAKALLQILTDQALHDRYAQVGTSFAANYTWDAVASRTHELITNFAARRTQPSKNL